MVIDFQQPRQRFVVAVALAIALHEVGLGIFHGPSAPNDREDQAVTTKIVFEKPRPTPTPRPTPRATPTPTPTLPPTPPPRVTPPPHVKIAEAPHVAGRAKGKPAQHLGGGAHKAVTATHATTFAKPKAAGSGTGASTGNGSGVTPGTGGGLAGAGTGTAGNGNAGENANTPCGFVDFAPRSAPRYSNGTATEIVYATVTFPDGHQESERFPYPWVYPNGEQTDPWSDTNLARVREAQRAGAEPPEAPLQLPPPGTDTSGYSSLIQYILKHTIAGGFTVLKPCPKGRG